ncbi:MAG: hypothetical protein PHU42_01985 [Patescibacteria group bacterium]|nr:hypothetical protein [Patescibacteria group bacterium]
MKMALLVLFTIVGIILYFRIVLGSQGRKQKEIEAQSTNPRKR